MKLKTDLKPDEVMAILRREIDHMPSLCRCFFTLNAHRYRGTSAVCGEVRGNEFELRNRRDPYLSLAVIGKVADSNDGAEIEILFKKSLLYKTFQKFHTDDEDVILNFLYENLLSKKPSEKVDATGFSSLRKKAMVSSLQL